MTKLIKFIEIHTGAKTIENGFIRFNQEIKEIGDMNQFVSEADDVEIETNADLLIPGFIDVHTHGGYGIDTMDADPEKTNEMLNKMRHEGITSVFLTTITQSIEEIEKALSAAKKTIEENPVAIGIHLEGPYINPTMNGAQPKEFVIQASTEQIAHWQEISGNNIRLITYAPEMNDDPDFEQKLIELNIVPSVGHSNAHYNDLLKTKASHITHLYNRQLQMTGREPGVTGFGLSNKNVKGVEIITDGIHVTPAMVKVAVRAKGSKNMEMITDSMRSKGLGEGISELGGQRVTVKNGEARLDNGDLAGSVLLYIDGFKNMQNFAEVDIDQVIQMSSINQAREFGLDKIGVLQAGNLANFNLLDENQNILDNFVHGRGLNDA
ncbi:MAG: N-acetylglucosamine-6-phosphate deacetylase [Lactobacillaceae bacterium]|jgi:N-acetylglucosamine-6-phosphate deacetylase|nr:N-acetylglucosamine-6-phosphate deacetylase [Lactobacillaceae bacterium]